MKTRFCVPALIACCLVSCETPPPTDSSSFYYPSSNRAPVSGGFTTAATTNGSTPTPRGGYAPGSGPTYMPQGNQFMYQQNVSGPFGSRSSTGVIQSSGGVQSYQTIGGLPIYPGASLPGYIPNQPYYGAPTSQQPVYVPGVGGNPGYYINPNTGARVQP
ncbi:hypothetical protein [Prosthecobacter sp.]|uniref:hypothetical protein n=1 Tax=Prosthecobacter sp. TaxID=1965333 RepID=UPI001E063FDE|nr:hypothetical protein [Prosthecobacter sp.]MCB1278790.1 hypothetical protein [Prosthecobacter sp.]